MTTPLSLDVVIFGGGAAGLWLLDELVRTGYRTLLLEAHDLGSGQTIASQGIIHGGLKYTLGGLFTPSAKAISEMPLVWRRCLAGEGQPDLAGTRMRAEFCYIWRTQSLTSRLAMLGARAGLRVAPVKLNDDQRPAVLAQCPGVVARLDEQVIEPASFLAHLGNLHAPHIIKIDGGHGVEFDCSDKGNANLVRLINPDTGDPLDLQPGVIVLTAGAGNASLRQKLGLPETDMQRRPLHMVMMRGQNLPTLNGHCVEAKATRLTITSTRDFSDTTVWQIGGQIAEAGVNMQQSQLIEFARDELKATLPGLYLGAMEWATYRVDRAEPATRGRTRPDDAYAVRVGNTITAWPTKLALVPEMVRQTLLLIDAKPQSSSHRETSRAVRDWPRPVVALPPWETQDQWHHSD